MLEFNSSGTNPAFMPQSDPQSSAADTPPQREQVFLSYSHQDEHWLEELQTMLKPLLKRRPISIWSDKRIKPGDEWRAEIHTALSAAKIAILLVSKHFLASSFIENDELPAILEMRQAGLKVLWIPLSHCLYADTELRHLQALSDVAKPLDTLEERHRGSALFGICEKIRDILLEPPSGALPQVSGPVAVEPPRAIESVPRHARDESEKNNTELNLLFGAVAIQNQFIDATQLAEASVLWGLRTSQSLSQILVESQAISVADRNDVQRLVDRRLRANGGNVSETLRASTDSSVCEVLRQSRVPEVLRSLHEISETSAGLVQPVLGAEVEWRSVLRQGTLGEIWSGFDPTLGREVALKVVRPDRSHHAGAHSRLLQEAQINGRLEHPHIVPVYSMGQRPNGDPYYSMRMVRGPTLAEDIVRHHQTRLNNRVDAVERRRLLENLLSVCHAVSYAHSRGFLHLDLKPQNVILGEFREVYLLDWGLSQAASQAGQTAELPPSAQRLDIETVESLDNLKSVGDPSDAALPIIEDDFQRFLAQLDQATLVEEETPSPALGLLNGAEKMTESATPLRTRQLIGTPAYMSPEQAEGNPLGFSLRTDVYGLGTILFEILTGEPPHNGERKTLLLGMSENSVATLQLAVEESPELERTLWSIQNDRVPEPTDRLQTIPQSLSDLCRRAMARKPDERFASAEDLALALEHWLDDEPLAVYRQNIERYEQKILEEPQNAAFKEGLARNFVTQGLVLYGVGRLAAAVESLERGIGLFRDVIKVRATSSAQADLAAASAHLNYILRDLGRDEDAEVAKRDALDQYHQIRESPGVDESYQSVLLPMMQSLDESVDVRHSQRSKNKLSSGEDSDLDDDESDLVDAESSERSDSSIVTRQVEMEEEDLAQWYYAQNGEPVGPVSLPQLLKLIQSATVLHSDLVWTDGLEGWIQAGRMELLFPPQAVEALEASQRRKLSLSANEHVAGSEQPPNENKSSATSGRAVEPLQSKYSSSAGFEVPEVQRPSKAAGGTANEPVQHRKMDPLVTKAMAEWNRTGIELDELIGQGGLGTVYRAHDSALNRRVALKSCKLEHVETKSERIYTEALITAELEHPGIVPVYGTGVWADGRPYFTMRLMNGSDWNRRLPNQSLTESLRILLQVADAVRYAHSRGIIHRDIKPSNVRLGQFGDVYLMDWGLAMRYATQSHSVAGSPAYMAPEMAREGVLKLGQWSDIYLLGAVLFEVLTEVPPHTGKYRTDVFENARNNVIVPTEKSGKLMNIAYKAMATDPKDRFEDVEDFQGAIRGQLQDSQGLALAERALKEFASALERDSFEEMRRSIHRLEDTYELWPWQPNVHRDLLSLKFTAANRGLQLENYDFAISVLQPEIPSHAELLQRIELARKSSLKRRS